MLLYDDSPSVQMSIDKYLFLDISNNKNVSLYLSLHFSVVFCYLFKFDICGFAKSLLLCDDKLLLTHCCSRLFPPSEYSARSRGAVHKTGSYWKGIFRRGGCNVFFCCCCSLVAALLIFFPRVSPFITYHLALSHITLPSSSAYVPLLFSYYVVLTRPCFPFPPAGLQRH